MGMSRECDFLRGQNFELRRLVDSMAVGPDRGTSSAPDFSTHIRAVAHIATRGLEEIAPESDDRGAGNLAEMSRFTRWLVGEMRALGGQE